MEDNRIHIDDLFREELGSYTEQPDDRLWQSLSGRLQQPPTKVPVRPYVRIIRAILALAIMAAIFYAAKKLLKTPDTKTTRTELIDQNNNTTNNNDNNSNNTTTAQQTTNQNGDDNDGDDDTDDNNNENNDNPVTHVDETNTGTPAQVNHAASKGNDNNMPHEPLTAAPVNNSSVKGASSNAGKGASSPAEPIARNSARQPATAPINNPNSHASASNAVAGNTNTASNNTTSARNNSSSATSANNTVAGNTSANTASNNSSSTTSANNTVAGNTSANTTSNNTTSASNTVAGNTSANTASNNSSSTTYARKTVAGNTNATTTGNNNSSTTSASNTVAGNTNTASNNTSKRTGKKNNKGSAAPVAGTTANNSSTANDTTVDATATTTDNTTSNNKPGKNGARKTRTPKPALAAATNTSVATATGTGNEPVTQNKRGSKRGKKSAGNATGNNRGSNGTQTAGASMAANSSAGTSAAGNINTGATTGSGAIAGNNEEPATPQAANTTNTNENTTTAPKQIAPMQPAEKEKREVMALGTPTPKDTVRKKLKMTFGAGVKTGYETGFNQYTSGGAYVAPYLQMTLDKLSIVVQPAIKYMVLNKTDLDAKKSYHNILGSKLDSAHTIKPADSINPAQITRRYYYSQVLDSYVISTAISNKSYVEFELPVLVQYEIFKNARLCVGASANFSKVVQVKEERLEYKNISLKDSLVFPITAVSSPTPYVPSVENRYPHNNSTEYGKYTSSVQNPINNPVRFNFMIGFNYEVWRKLSIDVMLIGQPTQLFIPDERVRGIYSGPRLRFGLGYRFR